MSGKLHRNPPFRAEHLGSMLRPKALLDKRHAVYEQKSAKEEELFPVEDESIKEIVKVQLDTGFRPITDGEYRRNMFWGSFWETLEGMTEIQGPDSSYFREYMPDIAAFMEVMEHAPDSLICSGKIRHRGVSSYEGHLKYLQSLLPKERWGDIKLTLAAPEWYHMRYREGKAYYVDVYASDADYFADIAKAYQTELDLLYKLGLRNVQIDDPNFAYFCAEPMLEGWKKDPLNTKTSEDLLDEYIALYNDCTSRAPADMHIGLHICRGNFVGSRHFSEGGYDRIASKLFQSLNVSTYYLEYDTPRAGGFEPLKFLPADKNVVLGVVTSKFPELEDKEAMKDRVYKAAEFAALGSGQTRDEALQRLGVSPQCGFASHSHGNALGWDDMVAKLRLVRQIADEVWPGQP